ncbi:MAG: CAP domain-containing protein [Patescibacteria group bacterium]
MYLPIAGVTSFVLWTFAGDFQALAAETVLERTRVVRVAQALQLSVLAKDRRLLRRNALQASLTLLRVQTGTTMTLNTFRTRIMALVNAERAKVKLKPMKENTLLTRSAQAHAQDMFARKFFSHRNLDGLDSDARIRAAGYVVAPCSCNWRWWTGENIARGQKTPESAFDAWMKSPKHKANILSKNFDEIGIGYSNGYWVQNFGRIEP